MLSSIYSSLSIMLVVALLGRSKKQDNYHRFARLMNLEEGGDVSIKMYCMFLWLCDLMVSYALWRVHLLLNQLFISFFFAFGYVERVLLISGRSCIECGSCH